MQPTQIVDNQIEEIKLRFFDSAVADVYRAVSARALTGGFILTFCLIDQLSFLDFGSCNIHDWVIKRLKPLNVLYTGREKIIAALRNGLIHNYGMTEELKGFNLEFHYQHNHYAEHLLFINDIFILNLETFIAEVTIAAFNEFEDYKRYPIVAKEKFLERANDKLLRMMMGNQKEFGKMNLALRGFDMRLIPTVNELNYEIIKLIGGE